MNEFQGKVPPHLHKNMKMAHEPPESYFNYPKADSKIHIDANREPKNLQRQKELPKNRPLYHPHIENFLMKEKRFSKKVLVEDMFPPHIRPASVLIGARGINHLKMQSSGCLVQLRGKGSAQGPTPWSDEPVHLFVKYDTEEQFKEFEAILHEIVRSCLNSGSRRVPPAHSKQKQGQRRSDHRIETQQLNTEVDLMWLFRIYIMREQFLPYTQISTHFLEANRLHSLTPYLERTSIPPGTNQLKNFFLSCPYFFNLATPDGNEMIHPETTDWNTITITLKAGMSRISKQQLKELHERASSDKSLLQLLPESIIVGRHDLPDNSLCYMVQAIHNLIDSQKNSVIEASELEDKFFQKYQFALQSNAWGFIDAKLLLLSYPTIFNVYTVAQDIFVEALRCPDFSCLDKTKSKEQMIPKPEAAPQAAEPTPETTSGPPVHPPQAVVVNAAQSAPRLFGLLGKLVRG